MIPSLLCFLEPVRMGTTKNLRAWFDLTPLPGQPCAQADEDQPGEPLLQSRKAGVTAKQLAQRSAGAGHAEIDHGAADVEDQAEQQNLPHHAAAARVNELGKKGEEEECDFRIEHVGDYALAKDGGKAIRFELLCGEIAAFDDHLDAKIDEVPGAGVAHHVEGDGRRTEQRGYTERSGQNMSPAAHKDAERGDDARFASLAQAAADDVKHVRAGRYVEHERGNEKREESSFFRHDVSYLKLYSRWRRPTAG